MIERKNTRSGVKLSQHPGELEQFISDMAYATSYLEIGARHGDTFYEIARRMPKGSTVVAVDMPGGNWGKKTSFASLKKCISELSNMGYDAHVIFGNSKDPETIKKAQKHGPYDVVFIDGDHLYEAVKADWENYRHMARIVAFHDIAGDGIINAGMPVEVPILWREIKQEYKHKEIIQSKFGIGILWIQ